MSEETLVIPEEKIIAAEAEIGAGMWGEKPKETEIKTNITPEVKTPASTTETEEEEILDPKEWLKREFEIDDPAILKAEREELKVLKANPPKAEEIKFQDEESKHIYQLISGGKEKRKELRESLEKQEMIENLSSVEVNKDNAEGIIKFQMRLKNPLTPAEIDFEYKQNYTAPKEPKQRATEEEDEFNERLEEWKEQVNNLQIKKIIAAKMAQPELSKLKSDIVLPQIQQKEIQQVEKTLTQKELDEQKLAADNFIHSVESDLKNFNEVSVTVKDKDVEILTSYVFSPEEKAEVNAQLKILAENNFNSNAVFADRWVNEDKTFNVSRMIRDMAILNNADKMNQKFAEDGANKRLNEYTKLKKNIQLESTSPAHQNGQLEPEKAMQSLGAAMWK